MYICYDKHTYLIFIQLSTKTYLDRANVRKLISYSILCCAVLANSYAQNPIHQSCGFEELVYRQQIEFPAFTKAYQQIYTTAKNAFSSSFVQYRDDKIYRIPVVVHVIWKEAYQNIREDIIRDQIEVLNEDFRRQNADADKIRATFKAVVEDAKIEFDLVEILRVKTDTNFQVNYDWTNFTYQYPDHVKQSKYGGSSPYDVKEFLNIWVCPVELDQFFGYAYPPLGSQGWSSSEYLPNPNFDGVVINYKAFGRGLSFISDVGDSIRIEGRTLVHEIGHYLGLKHPWGQITGNPCSTDDGLTDTPKLASPSFFDCEHDKNTCWEGSTDQPDMVENFMDFSSDLCKNSFTKEQVQVMRYVLKYYRPSLNSDKIVLNPTERVLVYPNPSTGLIKILIEVDKNIRYKIKLKNLMGINMPITIYNTSISNKSNYKIDLSGFEAGVYFLEFRDINNQFFTKKIILTN